MVFGIITNVTAPAEVYDAMHVEVLRRSDPTAAGLLLHVGRATDEGFQVIEVWESKDRFDTFNHEVMYPLMNELAGPGPAPAPPRVEEFDVRGLVVPGGEVVI